MPIAKFALYMVPHKPDFPDYTMWNLLQFSASQSCAISKQFLSQSVRLSVYLPVNWRLVLFGYTRNRFYKRSSGISRSAPFLEEVYSHRGLSATRVILIFLATLRTECCFVSWQLTIFQLLPRWHHTIHKILGLSVCVNDWQRPFY